MNARRVLLLLLIGLVFFLLGMLAASGCSSARGPATLLCSELGELCGDTDTCCEGSCRGCAAFGVGVCKLPTADAGGTP